MKKNFTAFAAFLMMNNSTAQVKVAAKASWNFSTARAVHADIKQAADFTFGYGIGRYSF